MKRIAAPRHTSGSRTRAMVSTLPTVCTTLSIATTTWAIHMRLIPTLETSSPPSPDPSQSPPITHSPSLQTWQGRCVLSASVTTCLRMTMTRTRTPTSRTQSVTTRSAKMARVTTIKAVGWEPASAIKRIAPTCKLALTAMVLMAPMKTPTQTATALLLRPTNPSAIIFSPLRPCPCTTVRSSTSSTATSQPARPLSSALRLTRTKRVAPSRTARMFSKSKRHLWADRSPILVFEDAAETSSRPTRLLSTTSCRQCCVARRVITSISSSTVRTSTPQGTRTMARDGNTRTALTSS
mmetsp:Transcript_24845/g.39251  ORF Transcript_24845/g.39251 Transcript_24845/m.39251 type:complete len:295 (+) Transcript_24845:944-1828(+)